MDWDPSTLDLAFVIHAIPERDADEATRVALARSANLPVRYNGVLPDMFADGRDVIVEGRVEQGVFQADTLLTTCPSKYEAELQPDGETAPGPANPL